MFERRNKVDKNIGDKKPENSVRDVARERIISERVYSLVHNSDIGCVTVNYLRKKLNNIDNCDFFIDLSCKSYSLVKYGGWIFDKNWSNPEIVKYFEGSLFDKYDSLQRFDENNKLVEEKIIELLGKENGLMGIVEIVDILSKDFELNEDDIYRSIVLLIATGRVYEPLVGKIKLIQK